MSDEKLDWLGRNLVDLVCVSSPIADTGDYSQHWEVVHHVERGNGRVIGCGESPQEAIAEAMFGKRSNQ